MKEKEKIITSKYLSVRSLFAGMFAKGSIAMMILLMISSFHLTPIALIGISLGVGLFFSLISIMYSMKKGYSMKSKLVSNKKLGRIFIVFKSFFIVLFYLLLFTYFFYFNSKLFRRSFAIGWRFCFKHRFAYCLLAFNKDFKNIFI